MAMVVAQKDIDYSIKPEAVTPTVDTSTWPLLLKNYDKRKQYCPTEWRFETLTQFQSWFEPATLHPFPMAALR